MGSIEDAHCDCNGNDGDHEAAPPPPDTTERPPFATTRTLVGDFSKGRSRGRQLGFEQPIHQRKPCALIDGSFELSYVSRRSLQESRIIDETFKGSNSERVIFINVHNWRHRVGAGNLHPANCGVLICCLLIFNPNLVVNSDNSHFMSFVFPFF